MLQLRDITLHPREIEKKDKEEGVVIKNYCKKNWPLLRFLSNEEIQKIHSAALKVLEEAGLRNQVKTLIGGAPVTQDYADEIGADGYAPDAASGVEKAKELLALLK